MLKKALPRAVRSARGTGARRDLSWESRDWVCGAEEERVEWRRARPLIDCVGWVSK